MKLHKQLIYRLGCTAFCWLAAWTAQAANIAYRNVVLGDAPIAYYQFDETSGTTAVNSGSGGATYDGTLSGAIPVSRYIFPMIFE